jgi:hypothetical protein
MLGTHPFQPFNVISKSDFDCYVVNDHTVSIEFVAS